MSRIDDRPERVAVSARAIDASTRTIVVALLSNLLGAPAKTVAAVVTRTVAMSAEASHAFADTGNQALLLVAQRTSRRWPDDTHPFGYGREAYFWALIASVVVFVVGAVFALREGMAELLHPVGATAYRAVYLVLGLSVILDGVSLISAVRQLRAEARVLERDFLDQVLLTSDPTVRAVSAEDAAAIAGDLVAIGGVALHHTTGSAAPEGVAAVLIGVMLVGVGFQLARRNHDFLLGEQVSGAARARVEAFLGGHAGVASVVQLYMTFVGPRRVWILVRVRVDPQLDGDAVQRLLGELEHEMLERSEYVVRVDVGLSSVAPLPRVLVSRVAP